MSIKGIVYNCKQATFLIEKRQVTRLSIKENAELFIHLMGCKFCRLYKRQSIEINHMVHKLFQQSSKNENRLDDTYKKQLQDLIDEERNKN